MKKKHQKELLKILEEFLGKYNLAHVADHWTIVNAMAAQVSKASQERVFREYGVSVYKYPDDEALERIEHDVYDLFIAMHKVFMNEE